jgi:hypothetical protein
MESKKIYRIFEEKEQLIINQMDDGRYLKILVKVIDKAKANKAKAIDKEELNNEEKLFSVNYLKLSRERKEIKELYIETLKQQYNISRNCIDIASQLQDMSDNGSSFESLEEYIVLLVNFMEAEKTL